MAEGIAEATAEEGIAAAVVELTVEGTEEATEAEGIAAAVVELTVEGIEEATEEAVADIMGDTITATAITGDMDMADGVILTAGVILIMDGAILIGGITPTGGAILTIPIMILITTRATRDHRCFHQVLLLPQNQDNSYLLIGTSVRTQKVTTPTLKIALEAG